MKEILILGAQGKGAERVGAGLYSCPLSDASSADNGVILKEANLSMTVNKALKDEAKFIFKTPRAISSTPDRLYVYTRTGGLAKLFRTGDGIYHLKEISKDTLVRVASFFAKHELGRASEIFQYENMKAQINLVGQKIILSTWISDRKQWAKLFEKSPGFRVNGLGGYTFEIQGFNNIDEISLLSNLHPTGPFSIENDVLYSCFERNLERISLKSKLNFTQFDAKGQILAISTNGKTTVWSDIQGGFYIKTNDYPIWSSSLESGLMANQDKAKMILPTEASACALTQYDGREYLILGLDEGKIRIYSVDKGIPTYQKTVRLLSLEKRIFEDDKNDYITNIACKRDYIQVTLRNMCLCWGMNNLLDLPDDTLIDHKYEHPYPLDENYENYKNYISTMKEVYKLESIVCVPHRITSMNIWEVNKW